MLNSNLETSDITKAINLTKEDQQEPKHSGRIIVNGSFPTMLTLDNLEKLFFSCVERGCWPEFNVKALRSEIESVLGKDERTIIKYLGILRTFIKTETGIAPGFYSTWNLSGILLAIKSEKKLQTQLKEEALESHRRAENARQKCKHCRLNIRKDGSCRCC